MNDQLTFVLSSTNSPKVPNSVASASNTLQLALSCPIDLSNYEIAIDNVSILNSLYNILPQYNNQNFSYIFNGTTFYLTIPPGNMSPNQIGDYLTQCQFANGHYLVYTENSTSTNIYFLSIAYNTSNLQTTLTCTPIPTSLPTSYTNPNNINLSGQTPQLIIPAVSGPYGGIQQILGFASTGAFPATTQTSLYQINSGALCNNPVSLININSSLVNNSNSTYPQSLLTINPNQYSFGQNISIDQPVKRYYPICPSTYNIIILNIVDQYNNPIPFINNTQIIVTLAVRRV